MNNEDQNFNEFFNVFAESVTKTLSKSLDSDICKNIQLRFEAFSEVKNAEDLKNDNLIYKIDYSGINKSGNLVALIPEELIANISDILTGGKGKNVYKGSLSELETNSVSKIISQIFKNLEVDFKQAYNQELIFSATTEISLKEKPEYILNAGNKFFDFLANAVLVVNEEEFKIGLLLNKKILDPIMDDLGFIGSNMASRKVEKSNIDLSCLSDININITAELGRTRVPIKYALELVQDSIVELDTQNNADIKVFANGVEFAYAQIVAIDDTFGLKITKIITPEERMDCI